MINFITKLNDIKIDEDIKNVFLTNYENKDCELDLKYEYLNFYQSLLYATRMKEYNSDNMPRILKYDKVDKDFTEHIPLLVRKNVDGWNQYVKMEGSLYDGFPSADYYTTVVVTKDVDTEELGNRGFDFITDVKINDIVVGKYIKILSYSGYVIVYEIPKDNDDADFYEELRKHIYKDTDINRLYYNSYITSNYNMRDLIQCWKNVINNINTLSPKEIWEELVMTTKIKNDILDKLYEGFDNVLFSNGNDIHKEYSNALLVRDKIELELEYIRFIIDKYKNLILNEKHMDKSLLGDFFTVLPIFKEIIEYRPSTDYIYFKIDTLLRGYSIEDLKILICNDNSFVNERLNQIATNKHIDKKVLTTFMYKLFITKGYKLKLDANIQLSLHTLELDNATGNTYYPNWHIKSYNCFGQAKTEARKALLQYDFEDFFAYMVQAVQSITVTDSCVFPKVIESIFNYEPNDHKPLKPNLIDCATGKAVYFDDIKDTIQPMNIDWKTLEIKDLTEDTI